MTGLVDAHCHLQLLEEPGRGGTVAEALERAAASGIRHVVCAGLNLEDSDRCRRLAEDHRGVVFTAGWHPHERRSPEPAEVRGLEELLRHPLCVGVGEVGLDRFWRPGYHETPLEVQGRSFRLMLELARAHSLPAVVHDREAHAEVLAVIDAVPGVRGVMHCMSGDAEHARRSRRRSFLVSFAGNVTYRGSGAIREAARAVDAEGYVVETDTPFLSPIPFRGTPNTPAHLTATVAAVAELRGCSPEAVAEETSRNAHALFTLTRAEPLGA